MKKTLAILAVLVMVLTSCHSEKEKHHETLLLEVSMPLRKDTVVPNEYVCVIHACRHIEVRALESGYLQQIYVDEGQSLEPGQMMFKIMPNIYEADLQKFQAEANVALIEYQNTKALADQNVVSQNELALAKANLDKANAEVSLAQTHLNFTDIKAPFAGLMDHLHVREGSLLEEGELLTTLSDNSEMWVYFNVPEAEYLNFMMNRTGYSPSIVKLELANGLIFDHSGLISTIEGEFDRETGNIEFRATFPNPDRILRHGETGNILMDVPFTNSLIIPQKATFEILDKKYVFLVDEDGVLHQQQITIAEELPHLYIVKDGLKDDDHFLIEGLRKVQDGDKIEVDFRSPESVMSNLELHAE
jgi:membrane fusion protein (multidrug efflux system)